MILEDIRHMIINGQLENNALKIEEYIKHKETKWFEEGKILREK